MYKILITSSYSSSFGAAIHTAVVEFGDEQAALRAIAAANAPTNRTGCSRQAIALF